MSDLREYLADLERRAQEADRIGASAPVAQLYRALAAELDALPRQHATPDRLLTADEVATRLGVSRRYVYAHAGQFPFTRQVGPHTIRFSEAGLTRYMERPALRRAS